MNRIKKILTIIGISTVSLTVNAQIAESLGISIVPLDVIEGQSANVTSNGANASTSQFTNKFVDNGYYIPGTDYKSNNTSGYEGLVGVQGMYGSPSSGSGNSPSSGSGTSSSSGGSSNNTQNIAIAGAVGAGAYMALQSEAGQAALNAGKELISSGGAATEAASKALNISSDALGTATGIGAQPPVMLLYGPTPTGDVFTFCNGPRPSWKSPWFYSYVYLCDGNPKQPGAAYIGFGS